MQKEECERPAHLDHEVAATSCLTSRLCICHTCAVRNEDKDLLYRVAYDEGVRALSRQLAVLDSYRTRAGLLLSSTALTTSFLASRGFDGRSLGPLSWMAVVTFVGVGCFSLAVLWPRPWEFSADSRRLIETYIEGEEAAKAGVIQRDLAIHMHNSYAANRLGIERLALFLQAASGLLTLEIFSSLPLLRVPEE
jgi:hypothetical protein